MFLHISETTYSEAGTVVTGNLIQTGIQGLKSTL